MGIFNHLKHPKNLISLHEILQHQFPISAQMQNILKLELQGRFTEATQVKFFLYYSNEDEKIENMQDPFVVCTQKNKYSAYCVFVHIVGAPTKDMIQAFDTLIDWQKADVFGAIPQHFFSNCLQGLCVKHGGLVKNPVTGEPCVCNIYFPGDDNEENLFYRSFEKIISKGLTMRPLLEKETDEILKNYEWSQPHSAEQARLCIRNLASTGIFVDGELASFGLLTSTGMINNLYTKPKFRRRGLGQLVLKDLCRQIMSMGLTPLAEYALVNYPSRKAQEKAGFKFLNFVNWVKFS